MRSGWKNYTCRGRRERWLYTNHVTGVHLFKVTEFYCGEKCVTFEARFVKGVESILLAEFDNAMYDMAFRYVSNKNNSKKRR